MNWELFTDVGNPNVTDDVLTDEAYPIVVDALTCAKHTGALLNGSPKLIVNWFGVELGSYKGTVIVPAESFPTIVGNKDWLNPIDKLPFAVANPPAPAVVEVEVNWDE